MFNTFKKKNDNQNKEWCLTIYFRGRQAQSIWGNGNPDAYKILYEAMNWFINLKNPTGIITLENGCIGLKRDEIIYMELRYIEKD